MREKRTYKDLEHDIDVLQREIIEATRVKDALHESEQKFRTFADSAPIAVMIYQDDRWIFVNKEAENITGYHARELLSKYYWDIVHPDHKDIARTRGRRRQMGEDMEDRYELKIITNDGTERWVWIAGATTTVKGRPAGVISAADITVRKKKDEALARSIERLEIISNTASQLLFSDDPQKMVDALCEQVMRHLDCHVFFNYLVNDGRNCLQLNASAGISPDVAEDIEFLDFGAAVCGDAAQSGCRIIANNIPTTPDPRCDLVRSFGITAYACHPLLAQGKAIGTLSFGTKSRLQFNEDEISLMKTIADQVAMAMQRINLLKSARAQAEHLDISVKERTWQLQQQADLLDLSHDAIIVADLKGKIVFWSTGAENTYGFKKQEVIGKYVYKVLQAISKVPIIDVLEIVKDKGHWEGELVHTCKSGAKVITHSRWALRLDKAGNPIEVMEVNRDITLRKQAEEALSIASSYNRSLIEASIDPLVTISPQGRINDVNIATERITGHSRDELIGTDFCDYFTDPEKARKGYQLVFEKGIVRDYELEIRRSDGHLTPVLYNASVYKNESGQVLGIFAAARDITEQRRLEDQLRQSQKMEAIGTLAGGIAHDFNNILAAIIGFSEMIEEDLPENSPSLNHIKKVLKAAGRGQDLVKQILAFSRKTAHARNILSVAPLIKETVGLLKASLPSTVEIRLSINAAEDAILASPIEVQQILMNLATNAAFAMRDSGGVLSIELEDINIKRNSSSFKNAAHPGQYIQLTVTDTGSGITRDIMDRVFDPFFTTKEVGEGTGMGLAVVYGIAQSLHGAVSVSSKPGKGATFRVIFPKVQAMRTSEEFQPSRVSGGTERILFIDDEALLIEWGKAVLKRLGYKVTALKDPVKAMEFFRDQPARFDLVITDQTMPELTGMRLAKELLSIRPDIPIILCTGHSDVASHDKAKNIGIREYLMKPLAKQDLARAVRKVLDETKT